MYAESEPHFLDLLEHAQHEFAAILDRIITIPKQKNKFILKFILNGLYEHFIEQLIQRTEGTSCSADKSSFVRNSTFKALKKNKNLSLYNDYSQCVQIKANKDQQAYWSPKTIPDTDTAIKLFWDWYLLRKKED